MSVYAYLTCPSRKVFLGVGRRVRDTDGRLTLRAWEDSSDWLPDALFAVLDDCAGRCLGLVLDSDEAFEDIFGAWTEIDDDGAEDYDYRYPVMALETYLDGRVFPPVTYHALLRPGRPVSEPTEFLRRERLGLQDREHVEITAQQAAGIVARVLWKHLRPHG